MVPPDFGNVGSLPVSALQRQNSLERGTQISGHSLDFLTQLEREKLQRAQGNYFLSKTLTAPIPGKLWEKYLLFILLFLLSKLGAGIKTKPF